MSPFAIAHREQRRQMCVGKSYIQFNVYIVFLQHPSENLQLLLLTILHQTQSICHGSRHQLTRFLGNFLAIESHIMHVMWSQRTLMKFSFVIVAWKWVYHISNGKHVSRYTLVSCYHCREREGKKLVVKFMSLHQSMLMWSKWSIPS